MLLGQATCPFPHQNRADHDYHYADQNAGIGLRRIEANAALAEPQILKVDNVICNDAE